MSTTTRMTHKPLMYRSIQWRFPKTHCRSGMSFSNRPQQTKYRLLHRQHAIIRLKGLTTPEDEVRVVRTCLLLRTGSIESCRPSHRNNKQASKKSSRRMPEPSSSKTFLQSTRHTQHQHLRRRNKLKLHQDRNESRRSLDRELTVAHMSLGNDIEFLSGNMSDREKAFRINLDFGNVLRVGV